MYKILLTLPLLILFYLNSHAQVNTESFRISSDSVGLSVISDIELTLMAGNTDFQYFGTNSRINYNWTISDHTFLIMNGGFGRNDGKTFYSQGLFHLRNVNSLSNTLQLEVFTQYDNNKSLLLLDRYLAGIGLRYKLLTHDKTSSRIGISFFGERELYDLSSSAKHDQETRTIRMNTYLTVNVELKNDLSFLSVNYLQPDILDFKDVRVLSTNALLLKLTKSIGLTIKVDARYDSRSADDIKDFDLISRIGLSITFE